MRAKRAYWRRAAQQESAYRQRAYEAWNTPERLAEFRAASEAFTQALAARRQQRATQTPADREQYWASYWSALEG